MHTFLLAMAATILHILPRQEGVKCVKIMSCLLTHKHTQSCGTAVQTDRSETGSVQNTYIFFSDSSQKVHAPFQDKVLLIEDKQLVSLCMIHESYLYVWALQRRKKPGI